MADILRMDYINSLPQPFLAVTGLGTYGVHDIAVDTPTLRIDVMGLLQIISMVDVREFIDASGATHDPDTFWTDYEGAGNDQ